jgi:hypothetical protein
MMNAQTLAPTHIEVVNFTPLDDNVDITLRYRTGYERLRNRGLDMIAFIENDDYYHPQYLEYMVNEWMLHGKPELLGPNRSIYYHLGIRKYLTMIHYSRASACNTLIKPDLENIPWGEDNNPYTDLQLWTYLPGLKRTFQPDAIYSIGIKHGIGKVGGPRHTDRLEKYNPQGNDMDAHKKDDPHFEWLQANMDAESFQFYSTLELPIYDTSV